MRGTLVETLLGAIVLIVAGWFLYFAFQSTDISSGGGYNISVQFERIDGLTVGSDVRVAGIKVGSVASQTLDPENFAATVPHQITFIPKVLAKPATRLAMRP